MPSKMVARLTDFNCIEISVFAVQVGGIVTTKMCFVRFF